MQRLIFFIDEGKRKNLLRCWASNWSDLTKQPIDEIYAYFGMKVNFSCYTSCIFICIGSSACNCNSCSYLMTKVMDVVDCYLLCFPRNVHQVDVISCCFWPYHAVGGFWVGYLFLAVESFQLMFFFPLRSIPCGLFRSLHVLVLPVFFMSIIVWAILFFQFWKRKNAAMVAR